MIALVSLARLALAQQADPRPSECFSFTFGTWTPRLDAAAAGHSTPPAAARAEGQPREDAGRLPLVGGDSLLILYPAWWPYGVSVVFDRAQHGDTLSGVARAFVADLRNPLPTAPVRGIRVPCGRGEALSSGMRSSRLRATLRLAAIGATTMLFAAPGAANAHEVGASPVITVYKDPNCGCCKSWIEHLRKHGFTVLVKDTTAEGMQGVKRTAHVSGDVASCHTAFVDGYVIEGHVPADDVKRLLHEHPKFAGLTVPGMVVGSPGMEGGTPQHYDVLSFDRAGGSRVYARH